MDQPKATPKHLSREELTGMTLKRWITSAMPPHTVCMKSVASVPNVNCRILTIWCF